jgi:hypothetical protein
VLASVSHLPTPEARYPVACPATLGYPCKPLLARTRMTSLSVGVRFPIAIARERARLAYVEAGPAVFFGRWTIGASTWNDSTFGVQANFIVPVIVRDSFSLEAGFGWIPSKNVRLPRNGYDETVNFRYFHVFGGFMFGL